MSEIFEPDIYGHEGKLTVSRIDEDHTYLAWEGRRHYEGEGQWTSMHLARQVRVIRELMRRQRERGENPILIVWYLSGVYEKHDLKPGDIGLIIDDTLQGPNRNAGLGPYGILEPFFGSRFQSKVGRVTRELGGDFMDIAAGLYGNQKNLFGKFKRKIGNIGQLRRTFCNQTGSGTA